MRFPLISRFRRDSRRAFTLIELLTVIAIIGILAGITFGVVKGVGEHGRITRATAELASLSTGLESYKQYYGDYPWVGLDAHDDQIDPKQVGFSPSIGDRAYNLFRALNGRLAPQRLASNNNGVLQRQIDKNGTTKEKYARSFIQSGDFSLERTEPLRDAPSGQLTLPDADESPTANDPDFVNALLDPWGHRYLYYYRDQTAATKWKEPSYLLYSAGPDGLASKPTDAGVAPTASVDADNIYALP
jgi:prepilin-type N-terminal cleavage/methylation domain-containing protein